MEFKFDFIGSATWVMKIDDKCKIACDPSLSQEGTEFVYKRIKVRRIKKPIYDNSTFNNVAIWVLTHNHFDHIDEKGIGVIKSKSRLVCSKNCKKLLSKRPDLNPIILERDESTNILYGEYTIEIKRVEAYHGIGILGKVMMGSVSGYLLTIEHNEEKRKVYISSDTVYSEKIVKEISKEDIDVFIPNLGNVKSKMLGGPFTMNIDMMEKFIEELTPKITFPVHIDEFSHFESDREKVKSLENSNRVKVLEPGESAGIVFKI